MWHILSSFIICVADFLHIDFVYGRFYCRFFHEIWKMLPTEYPNWHFWLKLTFSSVTCRLSPKSADFFSLWANYTDPNLLWEEPWAMHILHQDRLQDIRMDEILEPGTTYKRTSSYSGYWSGTWVDRAFGNPCSHSVSCNYSRWYLQRYLFLIDIENDGRNLPNAYRS